MSTEEMFDASIETLKCLIEEKAGNEEIRSLLLQLSTFLLHILIVAIEDGNVSLRLLLSSMKDAINGFQGCLSDKVKESMNMLLEIFPLVLVEPQINQEELDVLRRSIDELC